MEERRSKSSSESQETLEAQVTKLQASVKKKSEAERKERDRIEKLHTMLTDIMKRIESGDGDGDGDGDELNVDVSASHGHNVLSPQWSSHGHGHGNLDGLGLLAYESVISRNYPVVLGSLYIFGLMGLVLKLVSDLVYVWIDPRIELVHPQEFGQIISQSLASDPVMYK